LRKTPTAIPGIPDILGLRSCDRTASHCAVKQHFQVIAFDADDTLWDNEPYFQDAQLQFAKIMSEWISPEAIIDEHYKTEIGNIPIFGYGIKGFTLSLIETAIRISNHKVAAHQIEEIIELGKSMLKYPIKLLPGVKSTLEQLAPHYRIIVATKGDLMDQERKLARSGIADYFHHIEVMSEKNTASYLKLIQHLDIAPEHFLMIGNSLKSDILPVLEIGGSTFHIPYHVDWVHEKVTDFEPPVDRYKRCNSISEICKYITRCPVS